MEYDKFEYAMLKASGGSITEYEKLQECTHTEVAEMFMIRTFERATD